MFRFALCLVALLVLGLAPNPVQAFGRRNVNVVVNGGNAAQVRVGAFGAVRVNSFGGGGFNSVQSFQSFQSFGGCNGGFGSRAIIIR